MEEMSCGRRGETQKVGKRKKNRHREKAVHKYLMSVIKQKGLSQQNLEIFTEKRLMSYFSKEDLKDKN